MTRSTRCGGGGPPRLGAAALALALVVTLSSAWAAAVQVTSATLTETVTVGRASGGSVRGAIKECTPELLTIQPAAKPKARSANAADPPAPDPVPVPWKDVRSVSNGLTYRMVLDVWKAQRRSNLCPECRGERTVMCPVCKGTRHDPASAADCKTCHGELLVACKSAGEVDGQVPCYNNCLRLGVGSWTKDASGEMWRTFPFAGGAYTKYSDHHIGDVVVVDAKARTATDAGRCPICGGTTKVDDAVCHGTGQVPCPECLARKSAKPCPNDGCHAGRVTCPVCGGTGLKKA